MRLIDADELKRYIIMGFSDAEKLFKNDNLKELAEQAIGFLKDIDEQPTVCGSCRNCGHCDTNGQGAYCDHLGDWTDADWFCANWKAKKKDD